MRLVFSEAKADYGHYIFPYAVWAFPEAGETPADLFAHGFLPSSRNLDRFYLCRQVRVDLRKHKCTSENRRVLRKGQGIKPRLVPRAEFDFTPERREFYKTYADIRFGKDLMTYDRLDALFDGKITSHVLLYTDEAAGKEIGTVTLFLQPPDLAYYYYAFYDLNYWNRNLGMFMMTSSVDFFASQGFRHLYLGSCYLRNALYKTQFRGAEFFNGFRWSSNLDELKFMIRRGKKEMRQHLLESEEFREGFYAGDFSKIAAATPFRVSKPKPEA